MANARTSNKIYIDSTGEITTSAIKVSYIVFTPDTANDQIILKETSSGPTCLKVRGATAKDSIILDFSISPALFNGLYIDTLSSGATATIITTEKGKT